MDWSVGLNGASDLLNSASSVGNWITNLLHYRESLQREDTAVQRRASDLAAAGLSKTLAAGSSASSSYSASSAPQWSNQIASAIMDAERLKNETDTTEAQVANIKQDTANKKTQNMLLSAQLGLLANQKWRSDIDNRIYGATARERMETAINRSSLEAKNSLINKLMLDYADAQHLDPNRKSTRSAFFNAGSGINHAVNLPLLLSDYIYDFLGVSGGDVLDYLKPSKSAPSYNYYSWY